MQVIEATARYNLKRVVLWLALIALGLWEAGILRMDYFIRVTDHYAIYNSPRHEGWAEMSHSLEGLLVENVLAYGLLAGDNVAGRSGQGYFVALPSGVVRFFQDEDSWVAGCRALAGGAPPELRKPSRTACALWWKFQALVGAAALCWLWVFWRVVLATTLPRDRDKLRGGSPRR